MFKPLPSAALTAAVLLLAVPVRAQFTDPHTYDETPIGVNEIDLIYAHAHSNTSLNTSQSIAGAQLRLNSGNVEYTRYFGVFHRLAWVEAGLPIANIEGSIDGSNIQGDSIGDGDLGLQAGLLLKGGPALTEAQYSSYRPATTVGISLSVTAPLGQYNPDKILNLGANLWSFKPEIGLSHPFGPEQKWQIDAYGNISIYTNNTAYQGTHNLQQKTIPGLEGHLSYAITSIVWASFDTRYSFGGDTLLNGVDQSNRQQNLTLGTEVWIEPNSQNSFVFEFATPVVHINGPTYTGFGVKYEYTWSKRHR
jgi:hypothetical protein